MSLSATVRLVLAPLVAALLSAAELLPSGHLTAVAGVYATFVCAQAAVLVWGRYQLWLARRRLDLCRGQRGRRRGPALSYDHDDGRRRNRR